jgi:glyoxylase-like metal-dependent hydrolase (beta-lactamase superfamily II)
MRHFGERMALGVYTFVLRRDPHLVLVDTGMRAAHLEPLNADYARTHGEEFRFSIAPSEEIDVVLAEADVAHEDVTHVIVTHPSTDHIGNATSFPSATVVVSRTAWRQVLAPREPRYTPPTHYPRDVLAYFVGPGADRLQLADDTEEILPGLVVRSLPGHYPVSQAVFIETRRGTVCLAGNLALIAENIEDEVPVGWSLDPQGALESLRFVKRNADIVVAGHDPGLLDRFPGGEVA